MTPVGTRPPKDAPASPPERIVEVLKAYVSEERNLRIQTTLDARTRDVVPVLENLVNDHNGAAVVRTADALGLQEVQLIQEAHLFRISRKVARGAFKWLDILRHDSVEAAYDALRARGYSIWVSSVSPDSTEVDSLPDEGPIALVFGNERDGASPAAMAAADGRFHVPMYGFVESLNVSVAAALSLSSIVGRRRTAGRLNPLADRALLEARWYQRTVRASRALLAREGLVPVPSAQALALELR